MQKRRWTTIAVCDTFDETHDLIQEHRRARNGTDTPINRARRYKKRRIRQGGTSREPRGWAIQKLT